MKMAWIGLGCMAVALGSYAADESAAVPTTATAVTRPVGAVPTTQPADAGLSSSDAQNTLDRMLRTKPGSVRPLQPVPDDDQAKSGSVKKLEPESVDLLLKHEGDLITDRVGRLESTKTGWEFHFESDGRALNDPPMIVLPNSNLAKMEAAKKQAGQDLRFRVTGMITTYQGRNYLLVEKAGGLTKADQE